MTDTTRSVAAAVLAVTFAGCGGGSPPTPSPSPQPIPSPAPQPSPAVSLVTFTDPASPFSTTDIRDKLDQIVRFNTAQELIWASDDTRFPGYRVTGNFVGSHSYEVVWTTFTPIQRFHGWRA